MTLAAAAAWRDEAAPCLLVVDDEAQLLDLIAYAARAAGYTVRTATTGGEALRQLADHPVDLVLLDVVLPDIDGHDLCRRIRRQSDVPVLFLTVRADQRDVIAGLQAGGDDYMPKPFSVEELLLRVNAILRRAGESPKVLNIGRLELQLDTHEATADGVGIELTTLEFRFLRYLAANRDRVVSVPELVRAVWDLAPVGAHDAIVKNVVYRIRQKLDAVDGVDEIELRNVRGVGYQLRTAPDSARYS